MFVYRDIYGTKPTLVQGHIQGMPSKEQIYANWLKQLARKLSLNGLFGMILDEIAPQCWTTVTFTEVEKQEVKFLT